MEYRVSIQSDPDVIRAVMQTRRCAAAAGFDAAGVSMLGTVVSELARNIVKYANFGDIVIRTLDEGSFRGVEIEAVDQGPGIADVGLAMKDHFSTGGTLGLGLPGVKRMMDEMTVQSEPGKGTRVIARKVLP